MDRTLLKLTAPTLAHRPQSWVPRRYRRKTLDQSVSERAKAEECERRRWADEVVGLLQEARLPYATSAGSVHSSVAHGCCRGLRANTLRKRVSDWRPARRFMIATFSKPFPDEIHEIMEYVGGAGSGRSREDMV